MKATPDGTELVGSLVVVAGGTGNVGFSLFCMPVIGGMLIIGSGVGWIMPNGNSWILALIPERARGR